MSSKRTSAIQRTAARVANSKDAYNAAEALVAYLRHYAKETDGDPTQVRLVAPSSGQWMYSDTGWAVVWEEGGYDWPHHVAAGRDPYHDDFAVEGLDAPNPGLMPAKPAAWRCQPFNNHVLCFYDEPTKKPSKSVGPNKVARDAKGGLSVSAKVDGSGSVGQIVEQLEPALRALAAEAWADHPNNPKNAGFRDTPALREEARTRSYAAMQALTTPPPAGTPARAYAAERLLVVYTTLRGQHRDPKELERRLDEAIAGVPLHTPTERLHVNSGPSTLALAWSEDDDALAHALLSWAEGTREAAMCGVKPPRNLRWFSVGDINGIDCPACREALKEGGVDLEDP